MRLRLAVFLVALMACDSADVPREVLSPTDPAAGNMAMSMRTDGAGRATGPLLTLTSNLREPIVAATVDTPPAIVNVSAGAPIEFCWTADASQYGGVVVEHRYGWDIADPGDPDAWDVVSDYDGGDFCADPITFQNGSHVFYVEAFDNNGYSARIPVRLNITEARETISLDVRPGACPNPVNPKSRGALWVALPGSAALDANDVDLSSLSLSIYPGSARAARPEQSRIHDVTAPVAGDDGCECPDRGPDGVDDLNLRFSLRDLGLDPVPNGNVQLALWGSTGDGQPFIAVDCVRIVGVKDDGGPEPMELDTEILQVWSSYSLGGRIIMEPVNTTDALPDTVPYGSWITLFYDGMTDATTASVCEDPVNQCVGYQTAYVRSSPYHPAGMAQSGWLPRNGAEDNDPFARADSTSMNMGTMNYRLRVRSVDVLKETADLSPAEIDIVSNYQPTLTRFEIENFDGTGPDIEWDWWRPANFHGSAADTLEVSGAEVTVVREFYFVIKGEGRDHPKEHDRGGVKEWLYSVHPTDDPTQIVPLGQSGIWIAATQTNELYEAIQLTVRYSLLDDPGGWKAWAALPDWIGKTYDIKLRGRDTAFGEQFRQYVFVDGARALINEYPVQVFGRQTEEGTVRTSISIMRDDMTAPAGSRARQGISRL